MRLSVFGCRLSVIAAFAAIAVLGCRTSLPPGAPVAPVQTSGPEAVLTELLRRAEAFAGQRALIRMRLTRAGETRSFRAQLVVHDRERMELLVYSPVGTTAATVAAVGDHVTVQNNVSNSRFEGTAAQLLASYGFFTGGLTPAEMGMLFLGLPPRPDLPYEMGEKAIAHVVVGDVDVTFDPPAYPPAHLVVQHGEDRVEVDVLEIVAGD